MSALLARLGVILSDRKCPICGDWYDPADPAASWPHNNHPPEAPHA